MIPTHLNEEMDAFLSTVTHWCTKEDAFSMHGPQGRVKQENGNDFEKGCLKRNEESIKQSCFVFLSFCWGGRGPSKLLLDLFDFEGVF